MTFIEYGLTLGLLTLFIIVLHNWLILSDVAKVNKVLSKAFLAIPEIRQKVRGILDEENRKDTDTV